MPTDRPSIRRTRARRAWLALLALCIGALTFELGLRVIYAFRIGPRLLWYGTAWHSQDFPGAKERFEQKHTVQRHLSAQDGYTKYFPCEPRRDFDTVSGEVFDVTINAHGFRGEDFELHKPDGVVRVVTLGASSTFGYHDRDADTYPVQLESCLNRRCTSARFEVINLGIPHLASGQILALFESEGLPLEPDVVTFYEGINDATRVHRESSSIGSLKKSLGSISFASAVFQGARRRLLSVALLDDLLSRRARPFTMADLESNVSAKLQPFLANLEALRELCVERGIVLVVVSQQVQSLSLEPDRLGKMTYAEEQLHVEEALRARGRAPPVEIAFLTHGRLMRELQSWAATAGVTYVDGIGRLDRQRDRLVSWVHLDREGNRALSEAIADAVLERACRPEVR